MNGEQEPNSADSQNDRVLVRLRDFLHRKRTGGALDLLTDVLDLGPAQGHRAWVQDVAAASNPASSGKTVALH
jgi:hypothetical protein